MITKEEIEKKTAKYPIFEYGFFDTSDLRFDLNVRTICKDVCPQYGKSWSCPPAVGMLDECKARCTKYKNAFIFSTIAEVSDILNMDEMLSTRDDHIQIVNEINKNIFKEHKDVLILTAESCSICEECLYPNELCKYPEKMYPCIESQGILVTEICENHKLSFFNGYNTVTWFCLILY